MILKENIDSALDLIKDIESGKNQDIMPDTIAPNVSQDNIASGVEYNSVEDLETKKNITVPITESTKKLTEANSLRNIVLSFLENTDDGSFEAFRKSPDYSQAIKRDGSHFTKEDYISYIKFFIKNNMIDNLPPNSPTSSLSNNAYLDNSDDNSIYNRGEDFDSTKPESSLVADWEANYAEEQPVISDDEMFEDMAATVKEIIIGTADKRHALVAGDPGVGKTYTCKKTAQKYAPTSGKKFYYSSGAMSSALSSIIPFFYYHSRNEIIMLDDNDAMLKKDTPQTVQNIMKAILDPSALDKPVSVPVTMMKLFQAQLDNLSGVSHQRESIEKNGVRISIDTEALKEGRFIMSVDGKEAVNEWISNDEVHKFSNIIRKNHLSESEEDSPENLDLEIEEDEDEGTMPEAFTFNSSVIFISNLQIKDISPAVADRCENIEISLTLNQYMHRLQKILGGLCNGEKYSSRPQYVRDWAKKSVYVILEGIVEAFHRNVVLFKTPVIIRRKFTFRMFEEFCGLWARLATTKAENEGLNLQNQADRDKIAKEIIPVQIKRMLLWMKQPASAR